MSTILSIFSFLVVICSNRDSFLKAEPIAGWVERAAELEFPFIVSIARKSDITTNNPYGHICGGALITRRFVLTAASCILNEGSRNIFIRDYFVYTGSSDLAKSRKFEIHSWMSYESWKPTHKPNSTTEATDGHWNNDVALLRLSALVDSSIAAAKISCISPTDLEGKDVVTAGWGTFDDVTPQKMLKADLNVLKRDECLKNILIASNDPNYNHEDNIICTNTDTLYAILNNGDKGSPLLIKHTDGSYRIVGINLKAVPSVTNVNEVAVHENLHLSIHRFTHFIRRVTRCQYLCPSQ